MPTKYIRDPGASARRVRAIVESKESFVWATSMKEIKLVYDVANLGSDIVENILESLDNEGVKCFSGSCEPTQEKKPIILYVDCSEHAGCFAASQE
jgi:hypothetical protein